MTRTFIIVVTILLLAGCGGGITAGKKVNYDDLIDSGWEKYNQRAYDEAYQIFVSTRKSDSTRPEAYIGCGWTLLKRQHPDSAVVVFRAGYEYITTLNDSVDTLCGLSGSYLANGENAKVVDLFKQRGVDDYESSFPLKKHDFFLDEVDLEMVQALALYRMGLYSSAESEDPDNAVYHVNLVTLTPYEYTDPQTLLAKIEELRDK